MKGSEMRKYFLTMLMSLSFFAPPVYSEDKDLNIVFIPKSSDQAFWTFMRDGVEKGMRETGKVKLTWRGPAYNDDTEFQIKILEIYTVPAVDAIIIAPTDRVRLAEPVRKAAAMGIKVIVVDSALDGKHHLNFITTDNCAGGKMAANTCLHCCTGRAMSSSCVPLPAARRPMTASRDLSTTSKRIRRGSQSSQTNMVAAQKRKRRAAGLTFLENFLRSTEFLRSMSRPATACCARFETQEWRAR